MPSLAAASVSGMIAPFSGVEAGTRLPPGWELVTLPNIRPPEVSLVKDGVATVLRLRAAQAAGSVVHRISDPRAASTLSWRWKVDRVVDKADLSRKQGDDYAARIYVFFDVTDESLPVAERLTLKLGRLLYGADLPAAALCYVWDNRHPTGTAAWNAYSSRVRMIVVDSGNGKAGQWIAHTRDVAADYRAAFGSGPVPPISGIAVSADTDQTGETVTAWFGDLRFEAPGVPDLSGQSK